MKNRSPILMLLFMLLTALLAAPLQLSGNEICRLLKKGRDGEVDFLSQPEAERLLKLYSANSCLPFWSHENGLNPQAYSLISMIQNSARHGLNGYDPAYHLDTLISLTNAQRSKIQNTAFNMAQTDVLLSSAYMNFGRDLYYGILPRSEISERWKLPAKKGIDVKQYLRRGLEESDVGDSLERLAPQSDGYRELGELLIRYLRIEEAGGWGIIEPQYDEDGKESYPREAITERLRFEGDMNDESEEGYINAIKSFQRRHGIKADGIVGSETITKMNIPVAEKIAAIRLNMERWRWLGDAMDGTYITVNIPDYSLSVVDNNHREFEMKAILGKEERPTSIFNAEMKTIVVNPYWRVPNTILREDFLPKIRQDSGFLKKKGLRIFRITDPNGEQEIDPSMIDWKHLNLQTFPYYLRQDRGNTNVLGHLKFLFPNPYDIYIHDTVDKHLFGKKERLFSSGCIRIESPIKLAEYLLKHDGSDANVSELIEEGENKNIALSKPVKVFINYWTVWVDEEGKANFRDDLYGYDRELSEILGW